MLNFISTSTSTGYISLTEMTWLHRDAVCHNRPSPTGPRVGSDSLPARGYLSAIDYRGY